MDASLKASVHTYAIDVELSIPCLDLPIILGFEHVQREVACEK